MQIYFILLNIYYDFLHMIRSLSAQSNIIFALKPRIYYQNICILPINIRITYFRTWNSPTFRRFQLSAILFDFLQTNLDRFFWKIPSFYYF